MVNKDVKKKKDKKKAKKDKKKDKKESSKKKKTKAAVVSEESDDEFDGNIVIQKSSKGILSKPIRKESTLAALAAESHAP